MKGILVFLEMGKRRSFAGALDWPGWCRSGRDEDTALLALIEYGPRYAHVLHSTGLGFEAPSGSSNPLVTERHEGNATTDFGAPSILLDADRAALDGSELERARTLLLAWW